MKNALIVAGGWEGHQPREVAALFQQVLAEAGFTAQLADSLEVFADTASLAQQNLIVPVWTMGQLTPDQAEGVMGAVRGGVGIAGCHGGMCDAFRDNQDWQFMTGGQWVSHPGDGSVRYNVHIGPVPSVITEGLSDFTVTSEQYYLHVDPAVKVHASTRFPVADGPHVGNGPVDMPVVWTKQYGQGKVFYNSLGHSADILRAEPCMTIMRRGFEWAAR